MIRIEDLPAPPADARIPYGTKANQFGDLRMPKGDGPHPTVIYLHGGFWRVKYDLTHAGHFCAALTGAGYATWSLEYRRLGEDGGGWPGTLEDVLAGALYLDKLAARYQLDASRTVLVGHSAGGHLALWTAAQDALSLVGVVSLAGVCDLRRAWEMKLGNSVVEEFLGGSPEQVPERYAYASPIELLPMKVPQHLVHGTADADVPLEISERFASASAHAKLTVLEGAGHIELIDPRAREWAPVLASIREW